MTLAIDSLKRLPEGASWSRKEGHAEVIATVDGDEVTITANCDSLEREVELIEERWLAAAQEATMLRETLRTEKEGRLNGIKTAFWAFIAGVAAGIFIRIRKQ